MKHFLRRLLVLNALIAIPSYCVTPLITPRSQSEDSARELAGWAHHVNLYDQECVYGAWAFTLEYMRSTKPYDVAECLFGTDLIKAKHPYIQIVGSQAGDRDETDWLADYFGLPTDFKSIVSFDPRVENVILDINFYLGLDEWLDGLYFRIHGPICYSRWDLNMCEKVIQPGTLGYRPGYFNEAQNGVARSQLLNSFTEFASLERTPNLGDTVIFDALEFAKFPNRRKSLTRLSDIQAALGWNFLQGYDHHFGLNIRMAAPTGNRPKGEFLFEPIVGNGHHWELGLGLTCHYLLWENECNGNSIGVYIDGNVTHMFGARQTRTFDLNGKPMSRYMLTEKLGQPVTNLFSNPTQGVTADSTAPSAQFQNLFVPLANLTTFNVNVSIGAQADITVMLNFVRNNMNVDVGYNYWGRSCEKIKFINTCPIIFNGCSSQGLFALKGDAQVYGFAALDAGLPVPVGIVPGVTPIPLSATENNADIHAGTNTPVGVPFDPTQIQNPNIDNPEYAVFDNGPDSTHQIVIAPNTNGGPDTQQRTSNDPVFVKTTDINLEGAETKGISNRLFTHISYNWDDCGCWTPYVGIGAFYELAHNDQKDCQDELEDDSCQSCSFSQWGIWCKAGVTF